MWRKKTNIFFVIKIALLLIPFFGGYKGNAQNAIEYYFKAIAEKEYQNIDQAIININLAINIEPNNVVFLTERGKINMQCGNYNSAISYFKKAEIIKSNSASYNLAQCYSFKKNVDSALFFLDKYVHFYDKKPMPDIVLDSAFYAINKTSEWNFFWEKDYYSKVEKLMQDVRYNYKYFQTTLALEGVNDIIKKYKTYDEAYYYKAKILFDGKNYKQAQKFCSKAIKYNPLKPEYYYLRAESYFKLKKYSKAIDDLNKYININPYKSEIYLLLSEVCYKNKNYTDAAAAITNYTNYFYKDYDALFLEAQINYAAGEFLYTIKILNNLLKITPNNAEYISLRGKSYLETHSYQLAYNDFNTCLDLKPQLTDIYFYRGVTEYNMNLTDAACADWKRAIKYKDYKANDYYYEHCKNFDRNNQ
ncbi:MAG: tetratricopeptide repeat protein [Bacteroidales bacterium]|nr:tetratricopeptide repeat protein [Bacteroidales bacterium]